MATQNADVRAIFGDLFESVFGEDPSAPRRQKGRGRAQKNLELVAAAREILREIQPASVRAVCYQLFNRKLIPDMSVKSTQRVSVQLKVARELGEIDWDWIVDETRGAEGHVGWEDPEEFAESVQEQYRRDRWADQGVRVEVWSEKGTIRGTLLPVLRRYGVQFRVMHGFGSATEVHRVAEMARGMGALLIVLYVGDYDPSGLYMSEVDLPARLREYGAQVVDAEGGAADIQLVRIALTRHDTASPELAAARFAAADKAKDARYGWFVDQRGRWCWELDALSPVVLRERVQRMIEAMIRDRDAWDRAERVQEVERQSLVGMLGKWKEAMQAN